MIFDHVVKYGDKYYATGEDVPIEAENSGVVESAAPVFSESSDVAKIYTKEDLSGMTVKEIKTLAEEKGINITKVSPKTSVIEEFLSQQ